MTRRPAAPSNLRNGLKWRDGRPRWEPSPANRACGFRGVDLRDSDGVWMDRGAATSAADARTLWAAKVREALRDDDVGGAARGQLRAALGALPPMPTDPEAANRRRLVADLLERGRAVLEDREPDITAGLSNSPRSVGAMIDGFFADARALAKLKPSTARVYKTCSNRIRARFGPDRVDELTPGQMKAFHEDLVAAVSISTANLTMGAFGAMLNWARWQERPWIIASPIQRLRLPKAPGRLVFWTVQEENDFVRWCDANGYADVADAVTLCLWTGARQSDVCKADVQDLQGQTWRYIPQKTEKNQQVALPGILPPVTARVERRVTEATRIGIGFLNATPMLWFGLGRRHASETIGRRFREAKAGALKAGAVPATFADKRLQDTRDTCVTRLYDAGVTLTRIGSWGGWAKPDKILRDHYLSLLDAGAIEDGEKLLEWARKQGLAWAAA